MIGVARVRDVRRGSTARFAKSGTYTDEKVQVARRRSLHVGTQNVSPALTARSGRAADPASACRPRPLADAPRHVRPDRALRGGLDRPRVDRVLLAQAAEVGELGLHACGQAWVYDTAARSGGSAGSREVVWCRDNDAFAAAQFALLLNHPTFAVSPTVRALTGSTLSMLALSTA